MQDLGWNSFSGETVGLNNPWYINSKGINVASFTTNQGGTFVTSWGSDHSQIKLWSDVRYVIKLPKVSLIKGIWWSTYNQVSISRTLYQQLLHKQIPKVQNDTDDLTVFLCFWDKNVKVVNMLLKLTPGRFQRNNR